MHTILQLSILADIAIVALILWLGLVWLRTTRARLAVLGLGVLGVIYLLAEQLELQLTAWILQGFFTFFVLVVVIVFQDDLRRLFERIGAWSLRRQFSRPSSDTLQILVHSLSQMAEHRIGALLVLPGRETLERFLEGGVRIDGKVSQSLLESLFDPNSAGHDGAVILQGDTVSRFGVHLPLSTNREEIGTGGTRHAAALGLAERTDALCIAVSEERGTITIANQGRLKVLDQADDLVAEVRQFVAPTTDPADQPSLLEESADFVRAYWREAIFSLGLAAGMWFLLVPGSSVTQVVREIPVVIENLPEGYELESITPEKIEVTFRGRRRDIYLAGPGSMHVEVDALLAQLGRRTFQVTPLEVRHPEGLRVTRTTPNQVRISISKLEEEPP